MAGHARNAVLLLLSVTLWLGTAWGAQQLVITPDEPSRSYRVDPKANIGCDRVPGPWVSCH